MKTTLKKILICGATGFIGRNLTKHFAAKGDCRVTAVYHQTRPTTEFRKLKNVAWVRADLRSARDVHRVLKGQDVVLQAAATTSGAKDIVSRPYHHVTDNAVMNSLIFRACHEQKTGHLVFFSCTTMYIPQGRPVKEEDFDGRMIDKYFGVGWTKVYIEKMCEFYAKLGATQYTAIRHSNIYGPYDKFDLERSHVFGATVAKVMSAKDGVVSVWGDGSDERDLLYVSDLVNFVDRAVQEQKSAFELVNLGLGRSVSVKELVSSIIKYSGCKLRVEYDLSKPSIGFKLAIDIERAKKVFGWTPAVSLEDGIQKTLDWYSRHYRPDRE
jgi:nucleoside-diphosphate-sugar epimerase